MARVKTDHEALKREGGNIDKRNRTSRIVRRLRNSGVTEADINFYLKQWKLTDYRDYAS